MRLVSTTEHWKSEALTTHRQRIWGRAWRRWNERESASCAATGIGNGEFRFCSQYPRLFRLRRQLRQLKKVRLPYWLSPSRKPTKQTVIIRPKSNPTWNTFPRRTTKSRSLCLLPGTDGGRHGHLSATTERNEQRTFPRELSERLRRFGGPGAQQSTLAQEAINHIRVAPDRERAFAATAGGDGHGFGKKPGRSR